MSETSIIFLPLQHKINILRGKAIELEGASLIECVNKESERIGIINWVTFNSGSLKLTISDVITKESTHVSIPTKTDYIPNKNGEKEISQREYKYTNNDIENLYMVAYKSQIKTDVVGCHYE